MRVHTSLFLTAIASIATAQVGPWPVERQDRWGAGCAIVGPDPSLLTTPWISNIITSGNPISHGPSLGPDGIGYFGDWVGNKIYKFNFNTGAILGSFLTNQFVTTVPALVNTGLIVCGTDFAMFGIDTTIMDYNWFMNDTQYVGGSVNIGPDGDVVFASSNGKAYRLHSNSGLLVWTKSGFAAPRGSMVFTRDDSKVVFAQGNAVTALNYIDGSPAWSTPIGSTASCPATAPGGTIVVGSSSGTVYGLNPNTGIILWTWTTLAEVIGAAAFSPDGTVAYVPSFDHRVYALRVADGVRLWSYTTSHQCQSPPAIDTAGRIYMHNKNGDLYCISPSGATVWQVHLNGESRGPMTIGPDATLYVGFTGDTARGLAIIRQQALSLAPETLSMDAGVLSSGGLSQILTSNDEYAVFDRDPSGSRASSIRPIVTTHTAYRPVSQISLTLETRAATIGVLRDIQLWNFNTNSWITVHSASESTIDVTTSVAVPNAQSYCDSNGLIKLRIFWTNGPTGSRTFTTYLDYVRFDIVPMF